MQIKATIILAALFCTAFVSACGGGSGNPSINSEADVIDQQSLERVNNMPNGFRIVGDHGVVQIDDSFFNLGLKAKGQLYMPPQSASMQYATLTVTADTPVLCIRPVVTSIALISVTRSGNQYTYTFGGKDPSSETFAWYLFDKMPVVDKWGAAMVWNASGQPVFNSDYPVMKVAAISNLPNTVLMTQAGAIDAGVASVYAVCVTQGRIQHISSRAGMGFQGALLVEGVKVTNTGAVTKALVRSNDSAGVLYATTQGGQLMLVDVSGL